MALPSTFVNNKQCDPFENVCLSFLLLFVCLCFLLFLYLFVQCCWQPPVINLTASKYLICFHLIWSALSPLQLHQHHQLIKCHFCIRISTWCVWIAFRLFRKPPTKQRAERDLCSSVLCHQFNQIEGRQEAVREVRRFHTNASAEAGLSFAYGK